MASSSAFRQVIGRFFRDQLTSMGGRGPFARVLLQAAKDPGVRTRLIEEPRTVLAEGGVDLPPDLKVEVLQNTEKLIHIVLPPLIESEPEKMS